MQKERQYQPGERVPGTEYVVVRLEAEGGHGALYLVKHHVLEKKLQMLKTLRTVAASKDLTERLKREAQMLAGMDHPHIVSVTSGGLTDEREPRPYFVMERLRGRSLAQILPAAPEGVGVDASLKVAIEVCDALEYIHSKHQVVHRDIKPDNIFLHVTPRNSSVTKLLDFGVAHIMDLEARYTKNNLFLGTPRYAAPEQVMGETPSPRTDLYAVGLLLHELLLGFGPFDDASTFAAVAEAHVHRAAPGFPKSRKFPDGLEELVLALLAKKQDDRPRSAEWVATQLRQIKRACDAAEQLRAGDLHQTDLSPVQNMLTGYRGSVTESGALPAPAEVTDVRAPLELGTTARHVEVAPAPGPRLADAVTRSLPAAKEEPRRPNYDTEVLEPGAPSAPVTTPDLAPHLAASDGADSSRGPIAALADAPAGATASALEVFGSPEERPSRVRRRTLAGIGVGALVLALVGVLAAHGEASPPSVAAATSTTAPSPSASPTPTPTPTPTPNPNPNPTSNPSPSPVVAAAPAVTAGPAPRAAEVPASPPVPEVAPLPPPASEPHPAAPPPRRASAPKAAPVRLPSAGL